VAELANQKNWSLLTIHGKKIQEIQFADRSLKEIGRLPSPMATWNSISPDGKWIAFDVCPDARRRDPTESFSTCPGVPHLAVVATDGTGFRKYSNLIFPIAMCWSPDDSKLTVSVEDRKTNTTGHLDILDVATGSAKDIDGINAFASEQCWSPDGKYVVYMVNQDKGIQVVRIYDAAKNKSREVASGGHPSWSPDGKRIAFLYCPPFNWDCAYQTIHPDGTGQTLLFNIEAGSSPLWWSPDSQYVAYISFRKFWEHSLFGKLEQLVPIEHLETDDRLRIRRLDDNSEDWLLNLGNGDSPCFQWIPWSLNAR
jgi:Tol biopolymer transport system component